MEERVSKKMVTSQMLRSEAGSWSPSSNAMDSDRDAKDGTQCWGYPQCLSTSFKQTAVYNYRFHHLNFLLSFSRFWWDRWRWQISTNLQRWQFDRNCKIRISYIYKKVKLWNTKKKSLTASNNNNQIIVDNRKHNVLKHIR